MAAAAATVTTASAEYPAALRAALGADTPAALGLLGNGALLDHGLVALLCSQRCPGHLIVQAYDLAVALREADVPVIGGFHTPMEEECFTLLLRGDQPVVRCPARSLPKRVPAAWRPALAAGRLLLLSPFPTGPARPTDATDAARNAVVAALARAVLVIHAAPGGKTEALCRRVQAWGTPLWTLASEANANLLALGARAITPDAVAAILPPD